MPLLAKLPGDFEPLRKANTPEAVSALIASSVMGSGPVEFQGWDTSRPILIALGETDYAGVAGSTVGQLPLEEGWVPGVRHQALVPATDATALQGSLAKLLSSGDNALPELAKGHPGAVATRFDEWSVVLLPADKAVRVVVFEEYVGLAEDKAFAHMSKRLDTPIHTTASAAAQVLEDNEAVVAAWFRPDRLRPLAATAGAGQMLAAVATVTPEIRPQLMATGMGILMASDGAMPDEGAEVDELGMTLSVDGNVLRLRQIAALSDEGERAFAAATKDVSATFAAAKGPSWADLVVRADIRALLNAVEPPAFAEPRAGLNDVRDVIREGGTFTILHLGTRHALGLARFAELAAGPAPFPTDTAPTAAHLVWTGMADDEMPKLAAALHWPKAHDISATTTLLQALTKDVDFASLQVHATEYEGAPTHVLGVGGVSKSAFALDTPSPAKPLIDLRANVPGLVAGLGDAEAAGWFSETSAVHFTLRHDPHALLGEFAWSPGGGEVEVKPAVTPTSTGAAEPIGNPANTEAERCVSKAAFAYAYTMRDVAHDPEDLERAVTEGLAEAGKAMACADAEPAAKAAAQGLRRAAVRTILDALKDAPVKAKVRKEQCALDKDAPYCL